MMARSEERYTKTGNSHIDVDYLAHLSDVDVDSINAGGNGTVSDPMHLLVDVNNGGGRACLGAPFVRERGNGMEIIRVRHGLHCELGGISLLGRMCSYANQRTISANTAVFATMLLAASLAGAEPGQQAGLFSTAEPTRDASAARRSQTPPDSLAIRQRLVTIDLVQLTPSASARPSRAVGAAATALPSGQFEPEGELKLNLFEDTLFTGIVERTAPTFSGGQSLSGRLVGVEGGTLTLVVNGDVVAGTVRTPEATYRIRPAQNGLHTVSQIDPSRLPPLGEPIPQEPPDSNQNPARR